MGVEFLEHAADGVLYEFGFVDGVNNLRKGESSPMLILIWAFPLRVSNDRIAAYKKCLFILVFFWSVFLDDEVIDDEVLALHRVLSHIIFQKLLHLVGLV